MTHESSTCFKKSKKPLMAYVCAADAQQEAGRLKDRYQRDMAPYVCTVCGFWHLAHRPKPKPKPRPQLYRCHYCQGKNGEDKITYPSEDFAERRAEYLCDVQRLYFGLRAYECPHGEGWHLTSRR